MFVCLRSASGFYGGERQAIGFNLLSCYQLQVNKACYQVYEEEFLMTPRGREELPLEAFSRYAGFATVGVPVKT